MNVATLTPTEAACGRLLFGGNKYLKRTRFFTWARIVVHGCILCVAVAESTGVLETTTAGILILALAILSIGFLTLARRAHVRFRLFRVNLLLSNSLGLDQNDLDNYFLFAKHRIKATDISTNISEYYRSKLPYGTKRLKSNLAETIYFSKDVWRYSSSQLTKIIILPSVLFLVVALAAPFLRADFVASVNLVIILIVAFLSEIHLFTERAELLEANERCELLYQRLMQADTETNIDLVQILCAYSAIAFAVPPALQCVYEGRKAELNQLWEREYLRFE